MSVTVKRAAFAMLTGLLVLASCAPVSGEGDSISVGSRSEPVAQLPDGFLRVVEVSSDPWRIDCNESTCGSGEHSLFFYKVPLPAGVMEFDVTVSVTMDYRLSAGDAAEAHVFVCPADTPPIPCPVSFLPPDRFPLSWTPGTKGSTTTLTWSGKGLGTGELEGWIYQLFAILHDGNGNGRAHMSGSKMTVVFEMWPSG